LDRSSVPHRQPLRPDERRVETIAALRRLFPLARGRRDPWDGTFNGVWDPDSHRTRPERVLLAEQDAENAVVTRQVLDTGSCLLVDSRCDETLQV
jgi:hypothetical protein